MRKLNTAIAIYSIFIGIAVIGMWTMILLTENIAEGRIEMGFHLYSEFSMAILCLVSGFMLLRGRKFARETNIGSQAMVIYSVINAAGYYGQRGDTAMMAMFIMIGLFSVGAVCGHYFLAGYNGLATVPGAGSGRLTRQHIQPAAPGRKDPVE